MTSPTPSPEAPRQQTYADRSFRSPMGVLGGALVLAFGVWLVVDAVLYGTGRTPAMAIAGLLLTGPLVAAFTLRPVVYAGAARMLVRNPFRTITIPWSRVDELLSRYSTEVVADGVKYQLWAVPVSIRARKRASRREERAASPDTGLFGSPASLRPARGAGASGGALASSDQTVSDLREMAEQNAGNPEAQSPVTVRWAYEILAPTAVGAVAVLVLLVI